jgi:small-conductance mechanosensitive channel
MDSIAKVQRQQRIDSLRKVTTGSPLIVEDDTLLVLYARRGGMLPEARVKATREIIESLAHKLVFKVDTLYTFEGEFTTDIMAGNTVVMSVTDTDGLWQGKPRSQLANEYMAVIQQKIIELHETYGLQKKLLRLFFAVLLIVVQVILIKLTIWLFARWRSKVMHRVLDWLKPINIKDYELFDVHRQGRVFMFFYRMLRILFILFQLLISVPLLFSIFPETKTFVDTIIGYILDPVKDILSSVLGFLPNLFKIVIIIICFRYLVRVLKYFSVEIASGRLKINGFYPDWAPPTFVILRVLCYALMLVMIWPLLPSSNSAVFQGVSVFMGLIVSLGSTSIIGNVMAGMVMTYMRPFRIGDYIKVGDTVGEVIEKTVLVTRIRTRKNEVITIQNSSLMGSQTSNYTVAAQDYKLIVHTKVTIGYDVPWQKVKQIMEGAAIATPGILHNPKPFMMTTSLDDFYVEYEINAFTDDAVNLSKIYSDLHQNLLKYFFDEGVEIMSPHIYARRDGIDIQMPADFQHDK